MAVRTKKNRVNPLNWKVPIVSKDGTPTPEFIQKWTQQATTNAGVPDLTTAAALSALLDTLGFAQGDILYRDTTLWKVLAPSTAGFILKTAGAAANPAWESVSSALDTIGTTQGNVLYRNGSVWTVLAPGTDGQLLSYDATAHAPKWSSIAGVLLGSGAPAAVAAAGTLYSRTDTAAVYSSQPTTAQPVIVQSGKYDGNGGGHNNGVVFGSAVTAGNLLVVVYTDASITVPTAGSGWTLRSSFVQAAAEYLAIYTRTAQVSDGTTPPNVVTGGPGTSSLQGFWELSGTDWSQLDGAVVINGFSGSGSPATSVMGSFTPSISTDCVLTAVVKFSTLGSAPTVGAPFSNDQSGAFFRVQEWIGHDLSPAAGTPIAATITWNGGFNDGLYCVIGLKGTVLVSNWVQVSAVGANPSATGGDVPVNGTAVTFMRSDGAPAIQKTSSTVFGLAKVDNVGISAAAGVISVIANCLQVHLSVNQSVTDSVNTLINFDVVDIDTQGAFNTTTHKYTPAAGKYLVMLTGAGLVATAMDFSVFRIQKNGVTVAAPLVGPLGPGHPQNSGSAFASTIISCNGTTDFITGTAAVVGTGGSDAFNSNGGDGTTSMYAVYLGP